MKITNRSNLPKPLYDMAVRDYKYIPKRYSVTSLLKPVRQILLTRRHDTEIEQDCSEMIWMLFGQAVHKCLEEAGDSEELYKEEKLTVNLQNGYTVSGILDLYDINEGIVTDYKTASVWKVMFRDYDEWRKQGLMYAWQLRKNGLPCNKAVFYAILKDWSKAEMKRKHDYPKNPVVRIEFDINEESLDKIDNYINLKMEAIIENENCPDSELPLCSEADRWNTGTKFAVMKKGRKTALRVLDSHEAALEWRENNGGDYIEERKGEDKKCMDYCSCCQFCDYWQKNYSSIEEA